MKRMITLATVSALLALSGCGGDSDSSGVYRTTYKKAIDNGNVYNCPDSSAQQMCTTDNICSDQKCDLIEEVTKVPDSTPSRDLCKLSNLQEVLVAPNNSCIFINQSDNTYVSVTCKSPEIVLDGKIRGYTYNDMRYISGANVRNYRFLCQ